MLLLADSSLAGGSGQCGGRNGAEKQECCSPSTLDRRRTPMPTTSFSRRELLFLLLVFFLASSMLFTSAAGQEEDDDDDKKKRSSVCFNNCSGHGTCRDFVCECHTGYHGGDCSFAFTDSDKIRPILSAGHMNISSTKALKSALLKHPYLLLGFSSRACHKCITAEADYEQAAEQTMRRFKVPLARVDIGKAALHRLASDHEALDIPSLVLYRRGGGWSKFDGPQTPGAITEYVRKQVSSKPLIPLRSVTDVEAFLKQDVSKLGLGIGPIPGYATMVVGFFGDVDVEEDELEEYREAAKELQPRENVYTGIVKDPKVCQHFKRAQVGGIDRTPALLAQRTGDMVTPVSVNLDEVYGDGLSIPRWIFQATVPLVGEITGRSFKSYEELGLPMLILFLDLSESNRVEAERREAGARGALVAADRSLMVAGETGALPNAKLLEEFRAVAADHVGRLSFVYADGVALEDNMRSLGLFGGKERLPSLAFNLRDMRKIPFSEDLPLNRQTISQFCADFLSGRLQNAQDAKMAAQKALTSASPVSQVNTAKRKAIRPPPKEVTGISEQYHRTAALAINSTTFPAIVLDENKDVMVLFHARICEPCSHLAPYFRKMAERFADLAIPSLVVARMDVSDDFPPADLDISLPSLPTIIFFPAHAKTKPYRYYSGLGKTLPMMLWAQEEASIRFQLPDLPHLSESDRELYKEQVYEREMARMSEAA